LDQRFLPAGPARGHLNHPDCVPWPFEPARFRLVAIWTSGFCPPDPSVAI